MFTKKQIWALLIPLMMEQVLGALMGIWIGMFIDWTVRGICFGLRYKSGKWAKKSVVSA